MRIKFLIFITDPSKYNYPDLEKIGARILQILGLVRRQNTFSVLLPILDVSVIFFRCGGQGVGSGSVSPLIGRVAREALHCVLGAAALGTASLAQAQRAPNAGSILNGVERTAPFPAGTPTTAPSLRPGILDQFPKEGETARVTRFHIIATRFPERDLQAVIHDYVGRDCTLGDLQEAAARITLYYQQHGYLARAYLPHQSDAIGVITIAVLEARLGKVVIDPASKIRIDPGRARRIVMARQPAGALVSFPGVERALATIASLPSMSAVGTLEAGDDQGLTDLHLKLTEAPVLSGVAIIDNRAERSLGTWRALGVISVNDLLGEGDQAVLTGMKSPGSSYGRVDIGLPIGYRGLRAGINGSGLSYRVRSSFNAARPDGWAITGGAWLRLPLLRSGIAAFDAELTYDHKRLVSRTVKTVTAKTELDIVSASISGSVRDQFLGEGVDVLSVTVTGGAIDLSSDPQNLANDRLTARVDGGFVKVAILADRVQQLGHALDWRAHVEAQLASTNLDSSEMFYLGGVDGLRAYPTDEGGGADGALARVELGWRAIPALRFAPFLEAGVIRQYIHSWQGRTVGGSTPNTYSLHGGGVAVNWAISARVAAELIGARTIGDNSGRINGFDADGKRSHDRLWFRLLAAF